VHAQQKQHPTSSLQRTISFDQHAFTIMPPKIIAKSADRQGGVLPVTAAARAAGKAPTPRLKLEIRRLPPGLTLSEFEETLGEEWRLGAGKVDWREYRQGKIRLLGSGKVPEQSRCYLHVVNEACVREFEQRFLEVTFQDRAGTHKNPDLKHLAPTLGYAPNQRTPLQTSKQRTDNRQGTIDQDPEFIAFLEGETQPITKGASLDALHAQGEKENEKTDVKTTPLIEDLREKKANKAKAAQVKADKVDKDKKVAKSAAKEAPPATEKDAPKNAQQQKVEQAVKEAGKAATKQAALKQAQQSKANSPAKSKKQPPSSKPQSATPSQSATSSGPPSPAPQRVPPGQRSRGNTDGIKKMLQKDLGIRPKPSTSTQAVTSPTAASPPAAPATGTSTSAPVQAPPKGQCQKAPVSSPPETKSPPKAYLKHANPSQGMTEILIQQALAQYGEMVNVTIDPRKGTAIAVFKDGDGLKKALDAKRVPVANGAVEVLEFRDRATTGHSGRGGFRGGRGGRGGVRGGATASAAPTVAT
jgi:regulator of nonsense transcripts 3